ncbi:hypothetical protein NXX98_16740 [Bacteroides thetaiotaomicron]|mgnify:CR=1 FL=1|uniref:hypothetical protein n=1 Tax=Bacteroides thetaiotaomicron TaxID=818 RepID=UPI00286D7C81|nr:hypothetical protein [Bacteroides thetaiotaomicron]MCS3009499.1 hypothetical protein [Bacteroides thetaiotaomicron]
MKKVFSLMLLFATISFLSSCSKDDDNEGDNGSNVITVNSTKFHTESAPTISKYTNSLYFEVSLIQNDVDYLSMYDLGITTNTTEVKAGQELKVEVELYQEYTDVGSLYSYNSFTGKVIVEAVDGNSITLKYDNFSFNRRHKDKDSKYTVNGSVKYQYN